MNTLKYKLVLIAAFFFGTGTFAQNFYIKADAGYAFMLNGQKGWFSDSKSETINDVDNNSRTTTYTDKGVKFSLGEGLNFGGSFGFMFNDYLGVDLGLNYLVGSETKYASVYSRKDIYFTGVDEYTAKSESKLYSRMFRIIPSIIITPNFGKINPYVRLGAILGFGNIKWYTEGSSSTGQVINPNSVSETELLFDKGMAIGVSASLGTEYKLSERLSLFGELNIIGLSYSPKKMTFTKNSIGGVDKLPSMTTGEKEIELLKEYTITSDNLPNYDDPSKGPQISFPYNSFGINFGVKFNLNSK